MRFKILVIILVLVTGFFLWNKGNRKNNMLNRILDHQLIDLKIGDEILKVEVVNTVPSIIQGLSNRDQIGSDGMLFIYPKPQNISFWMRNMKFDIDMVWIKDDKLFGFKKNVAHPVEGTADKDLTLYSPSESMDMVLEINVGETDNLKLEVGQVVLLQPFQ